MTVTKVGGAYMIAHAQWSQCPPFPHVAVFYVTPAKIDYRRAFNSLKHKKSIHNFIESGPTDQNAYCSDICNT